MTVEATARYRSRTDAVWLLLPYVLLLATSAYAGFTGDISAAEVPRTVAVSLALTAWHTFWPIAHPRWLEQALVPMTVYYIGMIALCTLLLQVSATYLALYLVCYPLAFVALPGLWAYAGLVLTTAVPVLLSAALGWYGPNLAIWLGGLAFAAVVGWSIRKLESETAARKAALTDLARAHADLERALAENLTLQDRLVAEAREAGIAAERARLAGEIHDTLAAALTGIVSQLDALDAELPPGDPMRERVRLSADLAREQLREARHSIQALRPTPSHGEHLHHALAELTAEFERHHGLHTRTLITGKPVHLPENVEYALSRAAREALTNVHRHAGVGRAHLTLSYLGTTVALDVADQGAGFDPDRRRSGAHGLQIMAERVRAVGGVVDLRTGPAQGTTVTVSVPLPAPTAASEPTGAAV